MKYLDASCIALLFVIIASVCLSPLVEEFTPKGSIILLGDSIFRNDAYVPNGKSVCDRLCKTTNAYCLAKDHATIADVYTQIEQIPMPVAATAFLSVGGNDILSHYVYTNHEVSDLSFITDTFRKYTTLTTYLEKMFPQMHIVLVDLYFPAEEVYSLYAPIIREWNRCIYEWAGKKQWKVLKVSQLLREPEDFAYGVEPSSTGTQKIVEAIYTLVL